MKHIEKIQSAFIQTSLTLSVAESCTGGLLAQQITSVPGSSGYFIGGIIAYSNSVKERTLGIKKALITKHGAVSSEIALAMANGIRTSLKTDYGIGITGIAGPDGGTKSKPVGLVYIAIAHPDEAICLKCEFVGTRKQIRQQAVKQTLNLLLEFVE